MDRSCVASACSTSYSVGTGWLGRWSPNASGNSAGRRSGAARHKFVRFNAAAAGESHAAPGADVANPRQLKRTRSWPSQKSEMYILRSDGASCSRETVQERGCLSWCQTSTQQELMVWKSPPRCVLVLKKLDASLDGALEEVAAHLALAEGLTVVLEGHDYARLCAARPDLARHLESFDSEERSMLHQVVDFVVCLGGDGVILHACTLFRSQVPPIIGFNMGSMGFLTNHEYDTFRRDLSGVVHGKQQLDTCESERGGVHITLRMRLLCEIYRRGENNASQQFHVLNEVVLDRGSSPFLSKIECWERGRMITRVQADGVMLATPTGSTAYSVAAGGSMVHPTLPAILFTPICPHSLSFRPVILPDYADMELAIPDDSRSTAWVCFDGKHRQELLHGDRVRVRMSPHPVPTINYADQTTDFFESLRRCFAWSDRIEQKPLAADYSSFNSNVPIGAPTSAAAPAAAPPASSAAEPAPLQHAAQQDAGSNGNGVHSNGVVVSNGTAVADVAASNGVAAIDGHAHVVAAAVSASAAQQ